MDLKWSNSALASKNLVQHYTKKYEQENKVKSMLEGVVRFKQDELSNEKRLLQWLTVKLANLQKAVKTEEGKWRYKTEYKPDEKLLSILEITKSDLENEKRGRKRLEDTLAVLERALATEQAKKKYEEEKKMKYKLQGVLDTTQNELAVKRKERELLEENVKELEEPLVDTEARRRYEDGYKAPDTLRLEILQDRLTAERQVRKQLEKQLVGLGIIMEKEHAKTKYNEVQGEQSKLRYALSNMQCELRDERHKRESLEVELAQLRRVVADGDSEKGGKSVETPSQRRVAEKSVAVPEQTEVENEPDENQKEDDLEVNSKKLRRAKSDTDRFDEKLKELERTILNIEANLAQYDDGTTGDNPSPQSTGGIVIETTKSSSDQTTKPAVTKTLVTEPNMMATSRHVLDDHVAQKKDDSDEVSESLKVMQKEKLTELEEVLFHILQSKTKPGVENIRPGVIGIRGIRQ